MTGIKRKTVETNSLVVSAERGWALVLVIGYGGIFALVHDGAALIQPTGSIVTSTVA
jgi:hypothetical protein